MSRDMLPGNYIRSRTGTTAYVVLTGTRHPKTNEPLVRLRFLSAGLTGPRLWTVSELNAAGARWYTRRPRNVTGRKEVRA